MMVGKKSRSFISRYDTGSAGRGHDSRQRHDLYCIHSLLCYDPTLFYHSRLNKFKIQYCLRCWMPVIDIFQIKLNDSHVLLYCLYFAACVRN
jgi:hypothetical protein